MPLRLDSLRVSLLKGGMKRTKPQLQGLPKRRTMRREEAIAFLGGEQIVKDAVKIGALKPCCKPSERATYFATVDVIAVESDLLAGKYPGRGDI